MALTKATLIDLNSNELILDLDADTSITADTDDTIHFKIAGADELVMTGTALTPAVADGSALGSTALEWSDIFLADSATIQFGADQDVTLTHVTDSGLALKSTATGDDKPVTLVLQTGEVDIAANDVLGALNFQAPDENTGTDAILVAAGIAAVSEGDFSSSANATKLSFRTAASAAAAETMSLTSNGDLFLAGGLIDLKNDGNAVSQIKFYCESSNAHAQTLIGAPHSEGATNILTLPGTGGNARLVSTASTATLTNKTLTSPVINTGTFGTSILPTSADGTTLGSASKEFSDLFLADASTIQFGNDQDVTLTHVADTGLLLNAAMKIQFRDSAIHISSTADGDLAIAADDEIDITSTLIDINGNVEISGTAVTTGVHTFTAVPVFPNNTVETADIQDDAITAAKIADNAVVTAGINANAVTAAKLNNDIISGTTALAAIPATDDELLISDAGTIKRIDAQFFQSTPAFQASLSSDQSIANSTATKLAFATEDFDSDGKYDHGTNYRFTPTIAGKYFIYVRVGYTEHNTSAGSLTDQAGFYARIYKNGSAVADVGNHVAVSSLQSVISANATAIVDLDSNDYVEAYTLQQNNNNDNAANVKSGTAYTEFGGFKLVGI